MSHITFRFWKFSLLELLPTGHVLVLIFQFLSYSLLAPSFVIILCLWKITGTENSNWDWDWEKNQNNNNNNNIILKLSNNLFYFHLLFWRLPDNFVSLLGFPENFHFYVWIWIRKLSEEFFHFQIISLKFFYFRSLLEEYQLRKLSEKIFHFQIISSHF